MCWVRPGVFDAKASFFWLQRMLIAVDLPGLERPANAISGTCVFGKSRRWFTVVKKRACQSSDIDDESGKCGSRGENASKLLYNKGFSVYRSRRERRGFQPLKNFNIKLRVFE